MVPNSLMFRVASVVTAAGTVLVLANWYAKPEAALTWSAPLAMFAVMGVVLWVSRRAFRRSTGEAAARRSRHWMTTGVVFGGLIMGIPLALTLARAYGLVDDPDLSRRSTGVLSGVFLVLLGNAMPKNLPPSSSMRCDGTRQQAFQRLAGWTWVLCGLGSAIAWLTLSIDAAQIATIILAVAAIAMTVVNLLRLRRSHKDQPAPGMS